jgi:putative protease
LNFSRAELADGVAYAHERGARVLVAVNTFPRAGQPELWHAAVDDVARLKADAVIVADLGLCDYAARRHPGLSLHLSVQASASSSEAIRFYHQAFAIRRAVLPRVLTVPEIAILCAEVPVEMEVFIFGGLCVMAEGRCALSSYVTGKSPNMNGACSPASHVRYIEKGDKVVSQLGGFTINTFGSGEPAGYPTLCKGRFETDGRLSYLFEEPTSLNTLAILPELIAAGVRAFKIEGRQRGRAYVTSVVTAFRQAVDAIRRGEAPAPFDLDGMTEGGRQTAGAYERTWR